LRTSRERIPGRNAIFEAGDFKVGKQVRISNAIQDSGPKGRDAVVTSGAKRITIDRPRNVIAGRFPFVLKASRNPVVTGDRARSEFLDPNRARVYPSSRESSGHEDPAIEGIELRHLLIRSFRRQDSGQER